VEVIKPLLSRRRKAWENLPTLFYAQALSPYVELYSHRIPAGPDSHVAHGRPMGEVRGKF
jgi:hypothetical protein